MKRDLNLLEGKVAWTQEPGGSSCGKEIQRILEALLFASQEPLALQKMREILESTYPLSLQELRQHLESLKAYYEAEHRGVQLVEIGHGFMVLTCGDLRSFVEILQKDKRAERLSKAALEVLAIISFKQPITKAEIEKIRGSDSSGTLSSLIERGLVQSTGRLEVPGRPLQFGTTRKFLTHFGLKDLLELQKMHDPEMT